MRLLVFGSRHWTDEEAIAREIDSRLLDLECVICGMARGADLIGYKIAKDRGIPVEEYPADWNHYGRAAGPIRNQQMLDEGKPTEAVGFHEDIAQSKGTKDMVKRLKKFGISHEVFSS